MVQISIFQQPPMPHGIGFPEEWTWGLGFIKGKKLSAYLGDRSCASFRLALRLACLAAVDAQAGKKIRGAHKATVGGA